MCQIVPTSNNLNFSSSSREELQSNSGWNCKEALYKVELICVCNYNFLNFQSQDHIEEVLDKWDVIDDEVWAKVIVLERNRRVARAYAKTHVLSINGSKCGFDGFKVGVNGFENPMRDEEVRECKAAIGAGCKLKMTENGDILIKMVGKGNVFVQNTLDETAVSNDILKLYSGRLEHDRAMKLFDIKKFKQNLNREGKRKHPDWKKIETQVIELIRFGK